ncbi:MAG: hypothetical protein RL318_901 [Fibrobacterota bacterium]|jgi:hypothetical protein
MNGLKIAAKLVVLFATVTFAASHQVEIVDIQKWKHPTKDVFLKKGISIQRVVLVDKIKPIFHVKFQVTPGTCDTGALNNTLREISKANAYWTYVVVDSSSTSVFLKAEVGGDPQKHRTTAIDYLFEPKCQGVSEAAKGFSCSLGKFEVLDRSTETDHFKYELVFQRSSARFESGSFSLDGIEEVAKSSSLNASAILLATFSGPGMNCHEQYRVFQIFPAGKILLSDPFGFCSDVVEVKRQGESVLINTKSEMPGVDPKSIIWENGKLIEKNWR